MYNGGYLLMLEKEQGLLKQKTIHLDFTQTLIYFAKICLIVKAKFGGDASAIVYTLLCLVSFCFDWQSKYTVAICNKRRIL